MTKAIIKIILVAVCAVILLALAVVAILHFTKEKQDSKDYWGGYGLPTQFKD